MSVLGPILFLLAVAAGVVAIGGMMNDRNNRYPGKLLLAALVLGILGWWMMPAQAHDHARPELQPWFESLRSRAKAACCDGSDVTRLDDVDWDSNRGRYRVRLNGQWVDVPEDAVVDGPNRAGTAMVWPFYQMGLPTGVRCFMPGSMS